MISPSLTQPTRPAPTLVTLSRRASRGGKRLQVAGFIMCILLLVQYLLGIEVNLFAKLPRQDNGSTVGTAVARAVANGPAELAIHAALGMFLILTAAFLLVGAAMAKKKGIIALSAVGLAAILAAAYNGAHFVGTGQNSASAGMADSWAVALLCYLTTVYLLGRQGLPAREVRIRGTGQIEGNGRPGGSSHSTATSHMS
jgi:hypothetical protein